MKFDKNCYTKNTPIHLEVLQMTAESIVLAISYMFLAGYYLLLAIDLMV